MPGTTPGLRPCPRIDAVGPGASMESNYASTEGYERQIRELFQAEAAKGWVELHGALLFLGPGLEEDLGNVLLGGSRNLLLL